MVRRFYVKATIAIAVMVLLGAAATARADTLTTFTLTDVSFVNAFGATGTASGTFVLDSTLGTVPIADVNITTTTGLWQNGLLGGTDGPFVGYTYDASTLFNAHEQSAGPGVTDFYFTTENSSSDLTSQLILGVTNLSLVASNLLRTGNGSLESNLVTTAYFRDVAAGSLVPNVSTTPLPAALPLFATGLGAFGLFGWRRKRKNAAALAAA